MTGDTAQRRLRDAIYSEAMLLADEARGYFDEIGPGEGADLDAFTRVAFACESLKSTTRIMHVVAWLLMRRAVDAGEITAAEARTPARRLGAAPDSDQEVLNAMPPRARTLIRKSIDLHRRVERMEQAPGEAIASPARAMQERLARAF